MGKIKVKLLVYVNGRNIEDKNEIEVPLDSPKTVQMVLQEIAKTHPQIKQVIFNDTDKQLNRSTTILYNGSVVQDRELAMQLNDGDILVILPVQEGG